MMEGVVQHNLIYVKFGIFTGIRMVYWKRTLENILYIFINGETEVWPKKCSPAEEKKPRPRSALQVYSCNFIYCAFQHYLSKQL